MRVTIRKWGKRLAVRIPKAIADEAGLKPGDVILEISRKQISSIDDYRNAVKELEKGKSALFLVKRGENTIYIGIKMEE